MVHRDSFAIRRSRVRAKLKTRKNKLCRLTVFKSNKYIYAQVVDDSKGITLVAANTLQKEFSSPAHKQNAIQLVGAHLAQAALNKGIQKVVFDKGGYKYHGRVKALADAIRAGGVQF